MNSTAASYNERVALRRKVERFISCKSGPPKLELSQKYPSRPIDFHRELGVAADIPLGNMSFCTLPDGNRLVSVRQFNYRLHPVSAALTFFHDFKRDRYNHFIVVDKDFNFLGRIECDYDISMLEDIRLVRSGNMIQASATDVSDGPGHHKMRCLTFSQDGARLKAKDNVLFPVVKEKNYAPISNIPGVFVTDILDKKIALIAKDNPFSKVSHECRGLIPYRGSSQLVPFRDGYAAIVHRRERHWFYDAFAFFDSSLLQCRISDEFVVFSKKSPVHFFCGLEVEGDEAVMLPCVHDRDTYLFRIPLDDFAKSAVWR